MQKPLIATIINFCSIEARFIEACIQQCRHFSRQIIIPVCDHLFNGALEDHALLQQIYSSFPDCLFIEYPFAPQYIPKSVFQKITPAHFWPCVSRRVGARFLDDEIETVLFLDADELPDGKKFLQWLRSSDYAHHSVLKLANYWYFREPRYQSLQWEDSVILTQRRILDLAVLLHESERDAIFNFLPGPKRRAVTGTDGQPMFHHFSWVRTKEEMQNKVRAWSHRDDRDWEKLIEKEFAAPFSGKDFVHGYSFRECLPRFQIAMEGVRFAADGQKSARVVRLTVEELVKYLDLHAVGWFKKLFYTFFDWD
jgi:hypothetical protein